MGGNLWCRSQLGKGSIFTFHVPFDQVPDSPSEWQTSTQPSLQKAQHLQCQPLEPSFASSPLPSSSLLAMQQNRHYLRGLRVLVVDDNSLMRKTMNAILTKEQCVVTLAENGQQVRYSSSSPPPSNNTL
jgi:hypothetical protein